MTLTVKDSLNRLQENENRLDQFLNDPSGNGSFETREGRPIPTVPALVEEVRKSASALGNPDGAAHVGYSPAEGAPTNIQTAIRRSEDDVVELQREPTASQLVAQHELKTNPHPQYANIEHEHAQYMTLVHLHATALLF